MFAQAKDLPVVYGILRRFARGGGLPRPRGMKRDMIKMSGEFVFFTNSPQYIYKRTGFLPGG